MSWFNWTFHSLTYA